MAAKKPANEPIDDSDVVIATLESDTGAVEPVAAPVSRDVVTTSEPAPVASEPAPAPQIVYVTAPQPPKMKSNRGTGSLIAVVATIVYIAVFAVAVAIIQSALTGSFSFGFLGQATFYFPALFFVIGMVLLALIANRAGWWAYVIGSVFVGLVVYFGTIGVLLLNNGIIQETPAAAAELFRHSLVDPLIVASGVVAREVAIWTGALISARGRRVKAKNIDATAAFEQDQAEKNAPQ